MDLAEWLRQILQGNGGEHIRLAPVDPIRAASLLHAIQGAQPTDTGCADSFYAALEEAALRALNGDGCAAVDDDGAD